MAVLFCAPLSALADANKQKLLPMMDCAGIYAAASYAVRHFEDLDVEEGQTRKQVADDFQRLSNILKYFASNSGYELELRVLTQEKIDQALARIKAAEEFETLTQDIEKCDVYVDRLHAIYND